ncbi:MAG TPA: 50S ribosomal protein L28 [Planctomycetaceae bacterium]|nr:50S ribosomal protein L28 [Planctomycetaceae bacterium]
MARVCEVCGKKTSVGNRVAHRGKPKYLGGVGTKVTGISRRQFKPNLQNVRVTTPNGTHKTMRVCARCIRSGAVTKVVRRAPFQLPSSEEVDKLLAQQLKGKGKSKKKK